MIQEDSFGELGNSQRED